MSFLKSCFKLSMTIIVSILMTIVIFALIIFLITEIVERVSPSEIFVEGIEHYDGERYREHLIFPEKIPETAVFAEYYRYSSDMGTFDSYLELRFSDRATMEAYLQDIMSKYPEVESYTHQNPLDERYTDFYYKSRYRVYTSGVDYTCFGFSPKKENDIQMKSDYEVLSYCYEDLTVITTGFQSYEYVRNCNPESNKIARYLKRFQVDFSEPMEYTFYFERKGEVTSTSNMG